MEHSDHALSTKKRGLSKLIKMKVKQASKQSTSAPRLVKALREEVGAISEKERKQVVKERRRLKNASQDQIVPRDMRNCFGGLAIFAAKKRRTALEAAGELGLHTVYVLGEPIIDSESQTVSIAYSSENLLLNAYRQLQYGFPPILQVDCTYRLILEGHACMLFGAVNAAQHFHTIGYGVCAKEDEAAHKHVFQCIKDEMERIVAQRIGDQQLI